MVLTRASSARNSTNPDPPALRRSPRLLLQSSRALENDAILALAEADESTDFDPYNYYLDGLDEDAAALNAHSAPLKRVRSLGDIADLKSKAKVIRHSEADDVPTSRTRTRESRLTHMKARRDESRLRKHARDGQERAVVLQNPTYAVEDAKLRGAVTGVRAVDVWESKDSTLVPAGDGEHCQSALLTDAHSNLLVYRSFGSKRTDQLADVIDNAVEAFRAEISSPEFGGNSKVQAVRGGFPACSIGSHKSYVSWPRHNAWYLKHQAPCDRLAAALQPVVKLANGIFKRQFPKVYKLYDDTMNFVSDQCPELKRHWGVFASMTINLGKKTATIMHRDHQNFGFGVCIAIPFGDFDHEESGRLCVRLGDDDYEFELPGGVPMFLPSALLTHWNTEVRPKDRRGSLVLWMPGALIRWFRLNGRNLKDMSKEEQDEWRRGMKERVQEWLKLYTQVQV